MDKFQVADEGYRPSAWAHWPGRTLLLLGAAVWLIAVAVVFVGLYYVGGWLLKPVLAYPAQSIAVVFFFINIWSWRERRYKTALDHLERRAYGLPNWWPTGSMRPQRSVDIIFVVAPEQPDTWPRSPGTVQE